MEQKKDTVRTESERCRHVFVYVTVKSCSYVLWILHTRKRHFMYLYAAHND